MMDSIITKCFLSILSYFKLFNKFKQFWISSKTSNIWSGLDWFKEIFFFNQYQVFSLPGNHVSIHLIRHHRIIAPQPVPPLSENFYYIGMDILGSRWMGQVVSTKTVLKGGLHGFVVFTLWNFYSIQDLRKVETHKHFINYFVCMYNI